MPDYQKGKIYKITSEQLPGKCYIGSTIQTLKKRMCQHTSDYKCYLKGTNKRIKTSFKICCYQDAKINLIEEFPCESKAELEMREGVYIKRYMDGAEFDEVVNKNIAGCPSKERLTAIKSKKQAKAKAKKFNETPEQKEERLKREKKYRLENPEQFRESYKRVKLKNPDRGRIYYAANKERLKEKQRLKRLENRDEINRKERERYHAKKII